MTKDKLKIFALIGLSTAIGFGIGYYTGSYISKKKEKKRQETIEWFCANSTMTNPEPDVKVEEPICEEEAPDFPQDDEHEEDELSDEDKELIALGNEAELYKTEHKGKIEIISEKEYMDDFIYDVKMPVFYFPDEGTLADEIGNELDLYSYVGQCFEESNFYVNDEEFLHIRNNPKEIDIKVQKITDSTVSSFYGI